MMKRLLSALLVLTMLASFLPVVGVSGAEETHTHDSSWTKWENGSAMPTAAGKYYLATDVELTAIWTVSADITLCLNGHHIRQTTANQRVIDVPHCL